jgi:hypothetical protein
MVEKREPEAITKRPKSQLVLLAAVSLAVLAVSSTHCAEGSIAEFRQDAEDGGSSGSSDGGKSSSGGSSGSSSGSTGGSSSGSSSSSSSGTASDASADAKADSAKENACTKALAALSTNFDATDAGFNSEVLDGVTGSWPFNPWGYGRAGNGFACRSGNCFGCDISQNYAQCARAALVSPSFDLSACVNEPSLKVTFYHAYEFAEFSYSNQTYRDGGVVELSGDAGSSWQLATPAGATNALRINPNQGGSYECNKSTSFYVNNKTGFTGFSATYTQVAIEIPKSLRTNNFRIRFAMSSGVSSKTTNADMSRNNTGKGWRIDDLGFQL